MSNEKKIDHLNDEERALVEHINKNNEDGFFEYIKKPSIRINNLDERGMSLINHAAYRGNATMVKELLKRGADVNINKQEHGYTTLMFAALSGKCDVTQLILEAGAKTDRVNSVGRTATQMAAFVGQHQVVSLINNFLTFAEVDYYTKLQGFEKEPRLKPHLSAPLYQFILHSNLNPVRLSMYLQKTPCLLEESTQVIKVLDLLCERMMKQSDTNEVMAMKCHYMSHLLRHACRSKDTKGDNLETWIKSLLRGRDSDGFLEAQEKFIRATFPDFPYADSQLLMQIVRNLSSVKIGDDPTALLTLTQAINGQRMLSDDDMMCTTCGEMKASKKCTKCKMANYCDQTCQKLHWFTHKKHCAALAEQYRKMEIIKEEQRKKAELEKLQREKREKEEQEKREQEEEEKHTEQRVSSDNEESLMPGFQEIDLNKNPEETPQPVVEA